MSDSLKGRKLRPLIPKPTTSNPQNTTNITPMTITSHCSCIQPAHHHFSINHNYMGTEHEKTKTETSVMSSRWNPTPEQLHALEEMYLCGTRTPTAEQIQQIAAKLRRFGKIEGKNVFYWFQNHKARERQKRRRMMESVCEEKMCEFEKVEGKDLSGTTFYELNRTSTFEVGQRKKWAAPSNCSTLSKECASIHRALVAENGTTTDGWWTQFEQRELEERESSMIAKNATWQTHSTFFLNTKISTTRTTLEDFGITESKLSTNSTKEDLTYSEDESRESKTLQLFPVWSDEWNDVNALDYDTELPTKAMNTNFTPNHFFEFLPLKKN